MSARLISVSYLLSQAWRSPCSMPVAGLLPRTPTVAEVVVVLLLLLFAVAELVSENSDYPW